MGCCGCLVGLAKCSSGKCVDSLDQHITFCVLKKDWYRRVEPTERWSSGAAVVSNSCFSHIWFIFSWKTYMSVIEKQAVCCSTPVAAFWHRNLFFFIWASREIGKQTHCITQKGRDKSRTSNSDRAGKANALQVDVRSLLNFLTKLSKNMF